MTNRQMAVDFVDRLHYLQNDNQKIDALEILLSAAFVNGLRAAYESSAQIAERIGDKFHDEAMDPQEDSSDDAGEAIAKAIREKSKSHP